MGTAPLASYPVIRAIYSPLQGALASQAGLSVGEHAILAEAVATREIIRDLPKALERGAQHHPLRFDACIAEIEGLSDQFARGIEAIVTSISALEDTLVSGFEALAEIGEEQLAELQEVRRLLERPLDTAARELLQRAMRAFRSGLHEEALVDLTKTVNTNPYDSYAHLHIGHIHLLKGDNTAATAAYAAAKRYALAPAVAADGRSELVGGLASLGMARALSASGDHEEAHAAAQEAVDLTGRADCWYELARCAALAGSAPAAAHGLRAAFEAAPTIFLPVALAERDVTFPEEPFTWIRGEASVVLQELSEGIATAQEVIPRANSLVIEVDGGHLDIPPDPPASDARSVDTFTLLQAIQQLTSDAYKAPIVSAYFHMKGLASRLEFRLRKEEKQAAEEGKKSIFQKWRIATPRRLETTSSQLRRAEVLAAETDALLWNYTSSIIQRHPIVESLFSDLDRKIAKEWAAHRKRD